MDESDSIESFKKNLFDDIFDDICEEFEEEFSDIDFKSAGSIQKLYGKVYSSTKTGFIFIIDEWDCITQIHMILKLIEIYMQLINVFLCTRLF